MVSQDLIFLHDETLCQPYINLFENLFVVEFNALPCVKWCSTSSLSYAVEHIHSLEHAQLIIWIKIFLIFRHFKITYVRIFLLIVGYEINREILNAVIYLFGTIEIKKWQEIQIWDLLGLFGIAKKFLDDLLSHFLIEIYGIVWFFCHDIGLRLLALTLILFQKIDLAITFELQQLDQLSFLDQV